MAREYEVPTEEVSRIGIGKWVEIFEAYGEPQKREVIRVKRMRVDGKTVVFAVRRPERREKSPLHPHEGEIVYIDRGPQETRFRLRF